MSTCRYVPDPCHKGQDMNFLDMPQQDCRSLKHIQCLEINHSKGQRVEFNKSLKFCRCYIFQSTMSQEEPIELKVNYLGLLHWLQLLLLLLSSLHSPAPLVVFQFHQPWKSYVSPLTVFAQGYESVFSSHIR